MIVELTDSTIFREALPGDLPALSILYRQLHADDPELGAAAQRATFDEITATPGMRLFVLERDGEVVATAYLNIIPNLTRAARPYAVIENVVVDERLRGSGLGKALVRATLRAAWAAGCYKTMLLTGSREPSTHAFYRACGFVPDAKTAYLARP
jgi:GNAT superfamily N-acetyltransferase